MGVTCHDMGEIAAPYDLFQLGLLCLIGLGKIIIAREDIVDHIASTMHRISLSLEVQRLNISPLKIKYLLPLIHS